MACVKIQETIPVVVQPDGVVRGQAIEQACFQAHIAEHPPVVAQQSILSVVKHVPGRLIKIQVAIVVVVHKRGAGAELITGDAGGSRDVSERAVAPVLIENIGAVVGDVEVAMAIVIDITDGGPGSPGGISHAGGLANVSKGAIPAVAVEEIPRTGFRLVRAQGGPVDDVEVEVAIIVVVEEGGAAAVGFEDVVLFRAAEGVLEGDTRCIRLIGESREGRRTCRRQRDDRQSAAHVRRSEAQGAIA